MVRDPHRRRIIVNDDDDGGPVSIETVRLSLGQMITFIMTFGTIAVSCIVFGYTLRERISVSETKIEMMQEQLSEIHADVKAIRQQTR